jgi:hypothetical protein
VRMAGGSTVGGIERQLMASIELAWDAILPTAVSHKTAIALGLGHPKHRAFEHRWITPPHTALTAPHTALTVTKVETTHVMLL